jgi:hypothetical protein
MRSTYHVFLVFWAAALGVTAGCSRSGTADREPNPPARAVDQTRTTGADVRLPPSVTGPVASAGNGSIASSANAGPEDVDEPGAGGGAAQANRSSPALPFSSVSTAPASEETRNLDRHGDIDDPEAPPVPVEPSPVEEQIAMLNDGRDAAAASPDKAGASGTLGGPQEPVEQAGPPSVPAGARPPSPMPSVKPASPTAAPGTATRPDPDVSESAGIVTVTAAKPALSAEFGSLDKDDDGQIGLYEWPREKLAEFQQLDTNQDGFLTPAEFTP